MVLLTNQWLPQRTQQFAIYVIIPMIIHKKNNCVNLEHDDISMHV